MRENRHTESAFEGAFERAFGYRRDPRGAEGPHVRPFGWHPDVPIVRRIDDAPDLYLGNRHAANPERVDRAFDAVLTVATEAEPATTHHRPLIDGDDAEWERFAAAVDTARELQSRDGSLLVHCAAGISRSATVLATTLAVEHDRTLHDAFDAVHAARPHAVAHPRLHELATYYVAAADGSEDR